MKAILIPFLFLLCLAPLSSATWTGAVSENWHTPGNWIPASVPTITTDVVISTTGTGFYPRISTPAAYCHNMQIDGGTYVHVYTNSLNVTGDLSVAGYIQISFEPSAVYVEHNVTWQSGSQALLSSVSRFYCDGNMTFAAGSLFNQSTGTIEFRGTSPTTLINHAVNTRLPNVRVNKPWSAVMINSLTVPATNTQDIRITSLTNTAGSTFIDNYGGQIYLTNYLTDLNTQAGAGIRCNAGTLITDGINETFSFASANSYLNDVWTLHSGILSLDSNIVLKGNMRIWYGSTIEANTFTIYIAGNWDNGAGPAAFVEENGTVQFNGTADQYCTNSENFHNLTLNKSSGNFLINNSSALVTCDSYTWTAGSFIVNRGTFTAWDLSQNSIRGNWYTYPGGTVNLHQDSTHRIDLCANLYISGGAFRVYGGSIDCSVADGGDAGIFMTAGVLDFVDKGIQFGDYLYDTGFAFIGGVLRTSGGFWDTLGGLIFTGGSVELYGPDSVPLKLTSTSRFYDLEISKSGTVYANSLIDISHDLTIFSGALDLNGYNVTVDHNASVEGGLVMTANATLDVAGHVGWGPASFANTSIGTIKCGANWLFAAGCTADLAGTTARLTAPSGATIYAGSPSAKFGNLEIFGTTAGAYFNCDYGTTGGQLNVGGYLAVSSPNTLDLVEGIGLVEGDTFILGGGTLIVGDGGTLTTELNMQLSGRLVTGPGTAIVHGMFYFPASGSLEVEWGVFRCDAPDTGVLVDLRGALDIYHGGLEFPNLSVEIKAHVTRSFENANIFVGKNFRALESNSYQPVGGSLHLTGESPASLEFSATNFTSDLYISKSAPTAMVSLYTGLNVHGSLYVQSGFFDLNHRNLFCADEVNISSAMDIDAGASLSLGSGGAVNVLYDGYLLVTGTQAMPAQISCSASPVGFYSFSIHSGGTIVASYANFDGMDINGIRVLSGGFVDPTHCFDHCRFSGGQAGGVLLCIENNQSLTIQWTEFPANTWGGAFNVRKILDQGHLTFLNYIGDFSGEPFDDDITNRIDWGSPVPGVINLTIHYDPDEGFTILDWEYGFTCDYFRIYHSNSPEGPWFLLGTSSSSNPQYLDLPAQRERFYYVTAVNE